MRVSNVTLGKTLKKRFPKSLHGPTARAVGVTLAILVLGYWAGPARDQATRLVGQNLLAFQRLRLLGQQKLAIHRNLLFTHDRLTIEDARTAEIEFDSLWDSLRGQARDAQERLGLTQIQEADRRYQSALNQATALPTPPSTLSRSGGRGKRVKAVRAAAPSASAVIANFNNRVIPRLNGFESAVGNAIQQSQARLRSAERNALLRGWVALLGIWTLAAIYLLRFLQKTGASWLRMLSGFRASFRRRRSVPQLLIQGVLHSAQRTHRVLNGLLDFSRGDPGRSRFERTHQNPVSLLDGVLALLEQDLAAKDLRIERVLPPDGAPTIACDRGKAQRVLAQALTASIARSGPGEILRVGIESSYDEVMFYLEDCGSPSPHPVAELEAARVMAEAQNGRVWEESSEPQRHRIMVAFQKATPADEPRLAAPEISSGIDPMLVSEIAPIMAPDTEPSLDPLLTHRATGLVRSNELIIEEFSPAAEERPGESSTH